MKILLILGVNFIAFFIIIQTYLTMTTNNIEETQSYKVVLSANDFEIRFYPSPTLALINSTAKSYKKNSNRNNTNANEDRAEQLVYNVKEASIINSKSMKPEKKPRLPGNNSHPVEEEYVAAIEFGGYASDEDIRLYTKKLAKTLNEKSISYYGDFQYLGYNTPYQLFGRRNEIIVSVNWYAK